MEPYFGLPTPLTQAALIKYLSNPPLMINSSAGHPTLEKEKGKEEEEEEIVWEPGDTIHETIASLDLFEHFTAEDRKLTNKEIKKSYKNFDNWLDAIIHNIAAESIEKDNLLFQ